MDISGGEKIQTVGHFQLGRTLGEGAFCKVSARHAIEIGSLDAWWLAAACRIFIYTLIHTQKQLQVKLASKEGTDELYAVKIVNKDSIRDIRELERIMREMHVLKHMSHPNIISMHESIEKGSRLYLVLDYASAGELHSYCASNGPLPEKLARVFMTQMLSGVDFMHRQGVSHRDLKPENVLLVHASDVKTDGLVCKIADFGLSNDITPGNLLKTICGTPTYAAPEVTLGHKYDGVAIDLWGMGCILLYILSAQLAFSADSQPELFSKIQKAEFTVPVSCSPEASDLVKKLLQVDGSKRLPIAMCWQQAWLDTKRFEFSQDFDEDELESELAQISMQEAQALFDAEGAGAGAGGTGAESGRELSGTEIQELELLSNGVAVAAFAHVFNNGHGATADEEAVHRIEVCACELYV